MELLVLFAVCAVLLCVGLALLKALFFLVVLPLKIGFWALKGLIGLVILVPLAIVGACAASIVGPLLIGLLALPVLALVGGVIAFLRFIW